MEMREPTMKEDPTLTDSIPNKDETIPPDQQTGIKVYDRPVRRGIPLWVLLLMILASIALSWFAYQAIR